MKAREIISRAMLDREVTGELSRRALEGMDSILLTDLDARGIFYIVSPEDAGRAIPEIADTIGNRPDDQSIWFVIIRHERVFTTVVSSEK